MDHKCFEKGFPADINVMRARLGGHKMVTGIFLIKSRSPQHVQFGVSLVLTVALDALSIHINLVPFLIRSGTAPPARGAARLLVKS